jgi:hypothetical protein
MTNSEDRNFFEELNADLATQMTGAIKDAFKSVKVDFGKENAVLIGDQVAKAVAGAGGDSSGSGKGGGGGGDDPKKKGGFMAAVGAFGKKLTKFGGVLTAAMQPFEKAAQDIQSYGTIMGRTAAATGRTSLLGAKMLKDAGGNLKSIDFSMPEVESAFGEWGTSFEESGRILAASLKANVDATDTGTQTFLARSTGLGTDLGLTNAFLASNTNVIGASKSSTNKLGTSILNTATANNRVADSIFAAVDAFAEVSKVQSLIFSKSMALEMQGVVAAMEAALPKTGLQEFAAKVMAGDSESQLGARRMAARLGVDVGLQQSDPKEFLAQLIDGISSYAAQAGSDPLGKAVNLEALGSLGGIDLSDIQAADRTSTHAGSQGMSTSDLLSTTALTADEQAKADDAQQKLITAVDAEASRNMKNFAMSLAGASTAFTVLNTVSQTLRDSLYEVDGGLTALAKTLGGITGAKAGFNMTKTALDIGSFGAMAAGTFSLGKGLFRGVRRLFGGGKGGGGGGGSGGGGGGGSGGGSRAYRAGQRVRGGANWLKGDVWGKGGNVARAGQGMGLSNALNPHTGLPHNVPQSFKSVGKMPRAMGTAKAAFGKGASRMPLIGGLIAGGLELAETGDKSRAAMTAGGSMGGAMVGAATGAAIGSVVPIIGTAIGGLIGGVLGAWGGGEAGKALNDANDPDFVAKQAKQKAAEQERLAQESSFQGTPAELKAAAEADALAAASLDENKEANKHLKVIADNILLINNVPQQGEMYGSAEANLPLSNPTYHTLGTNREDDDAWENVYYIRSYNEASNRIRKQEAARGSNT